MKDVQPVLEVRNLRKHFISGRGKKRSVVAAVDDVSFSINEGETFGLVGESGCGKTTTGRTIIRLYDGDGGEVYFKGNLISGPMTKQKHRLITNNIAMIFQDPVASLNPRMTIQETIAEALRLQHMTDKAKVRNRVIELLERVGLTSEHATRYPHEFSGGQRQRVGIARALAVDPALIIADEPVSALDVSIQAQVINLLNRLKREMGLTMLFIAHDLSVVKYFSDRIGVMYYGKLVEMAPADRLYENPLHPYTRALISAIPQPNPLKERQRRRLRYDPSMHDYTTEPPTLWEVAPEHFVYGTEGEIESYRRLLIQ